MRLTRSKKGSPLLKGFWDSRPWSRILAWGKAFKTAVKYVIKNEQEALGLIQHRRSRKPPNTRKPTFV